MLAINKCDNVFTLSMQIAQSKNKLIAATALFVAVGLVASLSTIPGTSLLAQQIGQEEPVGQQQQQQQQQQVGQEGEAMVFQGTVISTQSPLPDQEDQERATILPLTQDGTIYTGVLTYTATEPVQVAILNLQNLNDTERALLNATQDEFGAELLTAQIDNQTSIVLTVITPDYGETPVPSASIPFAGNAVWLHSIEGNPFIASYSVSAQTQQAETVNNIVNITAIAEAEEEAEAEEVEENGNATATTEENGNATATTEENGNATATTEENGNEENGEDT
jgi:hypothetical protein